MRTRSSGTLANYSKLKITKQSFGTLGGTCFNKMTKLLRSGKEVSDVGDSTNKTHEEVGDEHSEENQVTHGQNKDEAPIDQSGQKLKVVDTIESSDSYTFVRILQDAVPQIVSSMKQNIDTSMVNSIRQAIDASLDNFEKILQDAL